MSYPLLPHPPQDNRPEPRQVLSHPSRAVAPWWRRSSWRRVGGLLLPVPLLLFTLAGEAQSPEESLQQQEDALIKNFALPESPPPPPVARPLPAPPRVTGEAAPPLSAPLPPALPPSAPAATAPALPSAPAEPSPSPVAVRTYALAFDRSPATGQRLRLQGVFAQTQLGFSRPQGWDLQSVKVLLRFQHSPALVPSRSNLTVRVNDTAVGSVPLNRPQSQIAQVLFNVPRSVLQNYNTLTILAQQNNDPVCSDGTSPTLWTEVLPDSQLLFEYRPKPVTLDFSTYPFPFYDPLGLQTPEITYLLPEKMTDDWLVAATRLQTSLGRLADYRPLATQLIPSLQATLPESAALVVLGTPEDQPALKTLTLPFKLVNNQWVDGKQTPFPPDVGLLMLTTTQAGSIPTLVITGNGPAGVRKAAQLLAQAQGRQIGTGQGVIVQTVATPPSPSPGDWPRFLPNRDRFELKDVFVTDDRPFQDVTVRGASAPAIEIPFRALPNEHWERGSRMTLRYSYSPQVNPRTSSVEVMLDNVVIKGARLNEIGGGTHRTLNLDFPVNRVTPQSLLKVAFYLNPREPEECGQIVDQQLWGTVHADTSFQVNRSDTVTLPDLKRLQSGYPFADPQDLSNTTIVVPDAPSPATVQTLLTFGERLGRLSRSEDIQISVYQTSNFPEDLKKERQLVGIGIRENLPFAEALEGPGLQLKSFFTRWFKQNQIQVFPDAEGVIKQMISPWNSEKTLLVFSGQTEAGLTQISHLLREDALFYQLDKDTVLISDRRNGLPRYDPDAYTITYLQTESPHQITQQGPFRQSIWFLQKYWYLLPILIIIVTLALYGISELYLNKVIATKDQQK